MQKGSLNVLRTRGIDWFRPEPGCADRQPGEALTVQGRVSTERPWVSELHPARSFQIPPLTLARGYSLRWHECVLALLCWKLLE